MKNVGKVFEEAWSASVPVYCWLKRLNDNAASWAGGTNTRFSSNNECDFLLFNDNSNQLYAFELKSTQSSLSYWRKDYEDKTKKQTFAIKKCQILGLQKFDNHNLTCGFVINFRNKDNRTFFIYINEFLKYTDSLNKKSINIDDVLQMNPIEISFTKLRVNYRYDIEEFLKRTTK